MSEARTKAELLEIWRRDMDPGYTIPLEQEAEGRGLDVISGLAAMLERASQAVQVSTQALYLKPHSTQLDPPASGGVKATGSIDISLDAPANGDLLFVAREATDGSATFDSPRAFVVLQSPDGDDVEGPRFDTLGAAGVITFIPAGTTGPLTLQLRAERDGFQGNVKAGTRLEFERRGRATATVDTVAVFGQLATLSLDASGNRFGVNAVGQYVRFLDGANAGKPPQLITARASDLSVSLLHTSEILLPQSGGTVEILDASDLGVFGVTTTGTAGGRGAELDLIARERAAGRSGGETDDELRARLCVLDDRVSPAALLRTAENILTPAGVPFELIEVGEADVGMAFFPLVTPQNTGDAFDNPQAYAQREFFAPLTDASPSSRSIGFLIVINGALLPGDEGERDVLLARLISAIKERKGGGVPWGIAFEPPLGGNVAGPSLSLGFAADYTAVALDTALPWDTVLEAGGTPAIVHAGGIVSLLAGHAYLLQLSISGTRSTGYRREIAIWDRTADQEIDGTRLQIISVTGTANNNSVPTRARVFRPTVATDIDARFVNIAVSGVDVEALFSSLTVVDLGLSV